ncbi:MAG: hypothetical protein AAGG07_12910 [Planctomycetota bacterium]
MIERVMKSRAIGVAMGVVILGAGAGVLAGMGDRSPDERGPVMEEFSDQVEWVSTGTTRNAPIDDLVITGRVWIEAIVFGPNFSRLIVQDGVGNQIAMSPHVYTFSGGGQNAEAQQPVRIDLGIAVTDVRVLRLSSDPRNFVGPVTIIYRRSLTGPARADVTTSGTNPGDAGYGRPDGVVDVADLTFFVEQWTGVPVA